MKIKNKYLVIILIAIVIEVILFNITSYRTFLGNYTVKEFSKKDLEVVNLNEEELALRINNIDMPVATIKIELNYPIDYFEYSYDYSDETTTEYMSIPSKTFILEDERTHYIPCYLSGKVNSMILKLDETIINNQLIEKIIINENIPFNFNFIRVLILIFIILIIDFIKNSQIMKTKYEKKDSKQEYVLLGVLGIFIIILLFININAANPAEKEDFYNKGLVDAFLEGSLSLLQKPSEIFLKLENPYDPIDRTNYKLYRNVDYLWDTAYYEGNFYVYFGILPVVMMFLPFFVITGKYLAPPVACLILSIIILILLKEILCKLFKIYFKNIPFKLVVFSLATLYAASLIFYINGCVRFYEIAIVSGVCAVLFGVFFMLKGIEQPEKKYRFIIFSCLSMALAVACRPTNVLSSIIIVPYLWKEFYEKFKNIKSEKKEFFKILSCIAIPYIIVAIPLMWYNYARFGSIVEFGSRYQITINDMRNLGSRIFAIPTALICNLFSIPNFIPSFPFVESHNKYATFYGFYFIENMIGGVFTLAPICFLCFYAHKIHKKFKNKELINFIYALIIVAVLITSISGAIGGSIQRYLFDYAWMFVLAGILIFTIIYQNLKTEEAKKILSKILCILTIYTIIINISAGIVSEKSYFEALSTETFYKIKYSICFWE